MKLFYTKIMVLLGLLMCVQGYCADTIRTFNANPQPIKTPFYAERSLIFRIKKKSGITARPFDNRARYWYQSPERYRIEMLDYPGKGLKTYQVRSSNSMYIYERKQWGVLPVSWDKANLISEINKKWEMKIPKLLGTEEMHGLQVEHWRGIPAGKYTISKSIIDIWRSTDKRFPLVVKVKGVTPKRTMIWELTDLRIGESIPDYMITPQINPKSGLLAQLNSRHKPLWMIIVYYTIYLLSHVLLIYSLTAVKSIKKKALYITSFLLLSVGLTKYSTGLDVYINQYSGLPVLILLAAMITAAIIYMMKKFTIPGDVKFFRGTRWTIIIWLIVIAALSLWRGMKTPAYIADMIGYSPSGLVFLLPTLITLLIIYLPTTALSEVVFRGYITGALINRYKSEGIVNTLQALAFTAVFIPGFIYGFNNYLTFFSGIIATFITGLILGAFRLKYQNLSASWIICAVWTICTQYGACTSIYNMMDSIGK
ncbi:MAG: CPBP family intramembrane glutamic endopeptidase [Armatimonadota bacterium]